MTCWTPTLRIVAGLAALAVAALVPGCGEEQPSQPPSLNTPNAIDVATRDRCGDANPVLDRFTAAEGPCSLGLITNAGNDRLAFADLGRRQPALFDLNRSVPSVTHVPVGPHPVDVAASNDGTVAYTLSAADSSLSVVDLWRLEPVEDRIELPGVAASLAIRPGTDPGTVVAALADPNRLWIREGRGCRQSPDEGAACPEVDKEATSVALPGAPSDIEFTPDGRLALVTYQSLGFASTVVFPATGDELRDRDFECRGPRTSPPCETRRIGLTTGCRDDVDNDRDGRIDAEDPQCYGPEGSERPDGVGRAPSGPCSNGIDDDGDGEVDRFDEDCLYPGGDEDSLPVDDPPTTVCSNGEDDDGDGAVDAQEDADCYGRYGRRESSIDNHGYGDIDIDATGTFAYVVDRPNSQILTVDLQHLELVDAGRAVDPPTSPFGGGLGVSVGSRPRSVGATVSRDVRWRDPDDPSHGVVQYDFGAFAASDNGRAYFVQTVSVQCEVEETHRSRLLDNSAFRRRNQAYRSSAERHCIVLPSWPIERNRADGPCADVDACESCLEEDHDGETPAEACRDESVCENFRQKRHACRAQGRTYRTSSRSRVAVNPNFSLRDTQSQPARLRGSGSCEGPRSYTQQVQSYADDNPEGPSTTGCTSSLRPQPISRFGVGDETPASFGEVPRADLLQQTRVGFAPTEEGELERTVEGQPWDFRVRDENWTVTWEGILPNTDREDGLFEEDEPGVLHAGGVDLCSSGVKSGDRLILRAKPTSDGDAPARCDDLRAPDDRSTDADDPDDDPYLTYRVDEVRPETVELAPIEPGGEDGSARFAQTLPTRSCFSTSVDFEIRPENEWIVVGTESGYVSERTSAFGTCLARHGGAGSPVDQRLSSRVEPGHIFTGPYLEFELLDAPVEPIRRQGSELAYSFGTQRFFDADQFRINTELPAAVRTIDGISGGRKLLIAGASSNFVYVRNLSFPSDDAIRLR